MAFIIKLVTITMLLLFLHNSYIIFLLQYYGDYLFILQSFTIIK